jgi:hypothetical protein
MSGITMPKCCISCENFSHKGYDTDPLSPFKNQWGEPSSIKRTAWGHCAKHQANVFVTELCAQFAKLEGITVTNVDNRPKPKEARQESLF